MEKVRSEFINLALHQFETFCKIKGIESTTENFAKYLVNRSIIKDITINRFIVISKYPEALNENLGIKKFAIWDLEEKVSVKESTIRVILKRFQKAFKFRERLSIPKI